MIEPQHKLIGNTLLYVARLVRQRIDQSVADAGLSRLSWLAAAHLASTGEMSLTELANKLDVGTATTGRLIDRMIKSELVERKPSEIDRRVQMISVTDHAVNILRMVEPVIAQLEDDILGGFTAHEKKTLLELLERIRTRLTENDE